MIRTLGIAVPPLSLSKDSAAAVKPRIRAIASASPLAAYLKYRDCGRSGEGPETDLHSNAHPEGRK